MSILGSLIFLIVFYLLQFVFNYISKPEIKHFPRRFFYNVMPALIWLFSIQFFCFFLFKYLLSHYQFSFQYLNASSISNLLFQDFQISLFFKFIGIIAFLDYATYWWHRFMHKFSWTRKIHRHHHSDLFVDTTTSYRFHLLELTMQFFYKLVITFIFGIGFSQLVTFEMLLFISGLFHHSRIAVPNLIFIVTPQLHFNHHLTDIGYANSNFGSILNIWDRIHKTYSHPIRDFTKFKFGAIVK